MYNDEYLKKAALLLNKRERQLTHEERWFLGLDEHEKNLSKLSAEERGDIHSVYDLVVIKHQLDGRRVSLLDIVKQYRLPGRDALMKALGRPPLRFTKIRIITDDTDCMPQKRGYFKPSAIQIEEICTAYEAGILIGDIAKRYNVSVDAVRYQLRKEGVELTKTRKRQPRLLNAEKEYIDVLHARGYSPEKIARETGYNLGQIRRYVSKLYGK